MRAGVGDHGRGAERAFRGVRLRCELDLGTAAWALADAGLLDLVAVQLLAQRRVQVPLADRRQVRVVGDVLPVAAMVAFQPARLGVEAQVRAAGRAGEAVLGRGIRGRRLVVRCVAQIAHWRHLRRVSAGCRGFASAPRGNKAGNAPAATAARGGHGRPPPRPDPRAVTAPCEPPSGSSTEARRRPASCAATGGRSRAASTARTR